MSLFSWYSFQKTLLSHLLLALVQAFDLLLLIRLLMLCMLLICSMDSESRGLRFAESKLREEKDRALRFGAKLGFLGSLPEGVFSCLKSYSSQWMLLLSVSVCIINAACIQSDTIIFTTKIITITTPKQYNSLPPNIMNQHTIPPAIQHNNNLRHPNNILIQHNPHILLPPPISQHEGLPLQVDLGELLLVELDLVVIEDLFVVQLYAQHYAVDQFLDLEDQGQFQDQDPGGFWACLACVCVRVSAFQAVGCPVDVTRFLVPEFLQLPDIVIVFLLDLQLQFLRPIPLVPHRPYLLLLRPIQLDQLLNFLLQEPILLKQPLNFLHIVHLDPLSFILQFLEFFLLIKQFNLQCLVLHFQLTSLELLHLVIHDLFLELEFLVLDRVQLAFGARLLAWVGLASGLPRAGLVFYCEDLSDACVDELLEVKTQFKVLRFADLCVHFEDFLVQVVDFLGQLHGLLCVHCRFYQQMILVLHWEIITICPLQYKMQQQSRQQARKKSPTPFPKFQTYCIELAQILNPQPSYYSEYKTLSHPLLRDHDSQYLLIEYTNEQYYIKINILYSLPYQIPVLYFMVFGYEDERHFGIEELGRVFGKLGKGTLLDGGNVDTGVYITQNQLTKEYMYTLHSCELGLEIEYLIPFYLSLLQLYPVITLPESYYKAAKQLHNNKTD